MNTSNNSGVSSKTIKKIITHLHDNDLVNYVQLQPGVLALSTNVPSAELLGNTPRADRAVLRQNF